MTKRLLVFIVNPRSGTRRSKNIRSVIEAEVDTCRYDVEIWQTEYAHHGTELAQKAAGMGAYAVVAVGGDGSVSDIAQGLIGTSSILGIIPNGSGNGMA